MMTVISENKRLEAARNLLDHIGELINVRFSARLWDGSMIPLGNRVDTEFYIGFNNSGVIGALLRRPTYENLLLQYVKGHITIHGDIIDFAEVLREKRPKSMLKKINKAF